MSANSKSGLHCELTQLALAAGLTLVSANVLAQSAPATNTLSTVTVTGDSPLKADSTSRAGPISSTPWRTTALPLMRCTCCPSHWPI